MNIDNITKTTAIPPHIQLLLNKLGRMPHNNLKKANDKFHKAIDNKRYDDADTLSKRKVSIVKKMLKDKRYTYKIIVDPKKTHLLIYKFYLQNSIIISVHLPKNII